MNEVTLESLALRALDRLKARMNRMMFEAVLIARPLLIKEISQMIDGGNTPSAIANYFGFLARKSGVDRKDVGNALETIKMAATYIKTFKEGKLHESTR